MEQSDGRARVIISGVKPEVDSGLFPAKAVVGEKVEVEADIFADGHDVITAMLLYRKERETEWTEAPMELTTNDRWKGSFLVIELGRYLYTVTAWIDRFKSWRKDFQKRVEAGQEDININLLVGANLIAEASGQASKVDSKTMQEWGKTLESSQTSQLDKVQLALSEEVAKLMDKYSDRQFAVTYPRELVVSVERVKARFSTWYEMFPRSCSNEPGRHGTFKDCEARLPYIAAMGFDVLYFPPIHPIGRTLRKGKNNAIKAAPDDPGTPWAIGAEEGGHKTIHPQLGTLEDFRHLVDKAKEYGIEIALDIAIQCSPDHPYVREHPAWFVRRPDGTIQYAENPPKKYQDIYPLNFESEHWHELWEEWKSVFLFWIEQGVRIFRVDNPHTKAFCFWQWLIAEVKKEYPDTIFLAEAFTRPKVMHQLAKLGFTQSYTYFAWRNTKEELTQYLTELTQSDVCEFYQPNFWPNTPDILTEYLQSGGRPAFMARLVLAATLASNYGIYGPPFELCVNTPREHGSEEYLDSEKYEIKHWDINRADSLKDFIVRVNQIRRENPALQSNQNLWFHAIDNGELICYSKHTEDLSNIILTVVNLNPHYTHSGWVHLPIEPWELDPQRPYQVHDLLSGARYLWHGPGNYVELNPSICPAHIFRIHRRIRREQDFDYYM
ncbi:MAG: alpha-1,4-glucan--maltose-1-phosphate maltosyltransferase [Dehalococcoidia bacterium]|nr:alpha-1,4-glucan--maltose-1-phosphate maltosyltransferase [Dehalococcoidia bacterium]